MKKWIIGVTAFLVTLGSGGGLIYYNQKGINSNNEFVSFEINNAFGSINQTSGKINVILPTGTNLNNLSPVFVATGPNVTVIGKPQYSGISTQNFESDLTYVVHASNFATKNYLVHVSTSTQHGDGYFTNFNILANNNILNGVISGTNINVQVPFNANLTSLISSYEYIGRSVRVGTTKQINNITINNFSSPVTYKITAEDGSFTNYTVNVSKYAANVANMLNFSIITNNGTYPCSIVSTNITCGIPPSIPATSLVALWSTSGSQVIVGSTSQISGLTSNNFNSPVTYTIKSPDNSVTKNYTVTVNNEYVLLEPKNIAETIFDNKVYPVTFKLTNNTNTNVTGINDTITTHHPFIWTLVTDGCSGTSLNVGESCSVTGTLNVPLTYGTSQVKFKATSGNGVPIPFFDKIVTAIPKITELESTIVNPQKYAAYTFNNLGAHRMFATATVNGTNIKFESNNIGAFTSQTESYGSYAVELVQGNNTLYIPAFPGVGGKILLSVDNKLPDGPTPSVTATNPADTYYTRWQQVEYGGGLTASNVAALFNLNPTNVNFVSLPTSISTVISGQVGVFFNNDYALQGIIYNNNILTESVLAQMESALANVPNASESSWNNLTQSDASGSSILRILSPSTVFPFMGSPSSQFYFNGAFYNQYINDLWDYYTDNIGAHYLYVDDSPVASLVIPGSSCVLRCQVTHADNLMHCAYYSGTCPTTSATGTLDGAYTNVGGFSSESGFTKFTPLDFVSAAGTDTATTFGANGTYRSLTGEDIVSGQSVGFLPFCSNPNFVFGFPQFSTNMDRYYQVQYNCLPNYSSYTTSIIDQYSKQSSLYFGYYNYGYSDTLNQSGAIYNINNESYPFTIDVNYQ